MLDCSKKGKREGCQMSEVLMNVQEIAEWLGVRPSWVYSHADSLGAIRVGKYLRFLPEEALRRLRAEQSNEGTVGSSAQRPAVKYVNSTDSKEQRTDAEQKVLASRR
jgi:hypothetical protein